jgi:predicted kinase
MRWMIPLFGQPASDGKRGVLEGRMISLALQLLRLNTNVVLDFGCWAREERAALQWLAEREKSDVSIGLSSCRPRRAT